MSLTLHSLKPNSGSQKSKKRVGRGNSSGHGTYSTRGLKGQRSRSGGKSGLKLKGLKQNLMNVPKLRGFNSPNKKNAEVKLSVLDKVFADGTTVTPELLFENGLVKTTRNGVKILGTGSITKKVTISGCRVTKGAQEKIEKAGGSVESTESQENKDKK